MKQIANLEQEIQPVIHETQKPNLEQKIQPVIHELQNDNLEEEILDSEFNL